MLEGVGRGKEHEGKLGGPPSACKSPLFPGPGFKFQLGILDSFLVASLP